MKKNVLNLLVAGALSCSVLVNGAGCVYATDVALAGAESADDAGSVEGAGGSDVSGIEMGASEILPADEMVTVLGAHSILTNEMVADEYEWVKVNLAGSYMPYVIPHAEGNPNVIHFLYVQGESGGQLYALCHPACRGES